MCLHVYIDQYMYVACYCRHARAQEIQDEIIDWTGDIGQKYTLQIAYYHKQREQHHSLTSD